MWYLDRAKKEGFPQKDAETIYRLWIDRISIAEIMKKISAEAKAAKAQTEAIELDEELNISKVLAYAKKID